MADNANHDPAIAALGRALFERMRMDRRSWGGDLTPEEKRFWCEQGKATADILETLGYATVARTGKAGQSSSHNQRKESTMKGWRTIAINCAVAVGGVLAAVTWSDHVPTEYAGIVATGVALFNMGLRAITNTPIGRAS